MTGERATAIIGHVDRLVQRQLIGWTERLASEAPLRVSAWIGEHLVATAAADLLRPDLGRHVGYSLALAALPTAADLASGIFRVEAADAEGSARLPLSDTLIADVLESALADSMAQLPMEAIMRAVSREMIRRRKEQPFARLTREVAPDELSTFLMPVGQVSTDGAVVVGRDGHLFLLTGRNQLVDQYRDGRSDAELEVAAAAWTDLFVRRAEVLRRRGIRYRQLIMPEKSSVLPECFPMPIEAPTRLMARIEAQVAASAMAGNYVPVLAPLRRHPHRASLLLPPDSHLAPKGIFFLLRQLLDSLGLAVPDIRFEQPRVCIGDLGSRFPGGPLCAVYGAPEHPELDRFEREIERTEFVAGPQLNGTRVATRNPGAPIDACAMVFGNSYFGTDDYVHNGSYWMARLFREYHFRWTPELDPAEVEAVRPDFVVCQTSERFLPTLPNR